MQCVCRAKTETALTCTRCATPICPQCFVPGAVGMLCKKCADLNGSPIFKISPARFALAAALGVVAGFVVGELFQQIGAYMIFLGMFLGGFIGEAIHRTTGRKFGSKVVFLTAISLVIGAALSLYISMAWVRYLHNFGAGVLFLVGIGFTIAGALSRLR